LAEIAEATIVGMARELELRLVASQRDFPDNPVSYCGATRHFAVIW